MQVLNGTSFVTGEYMPVADEKEIGGEAHIYVQFLGFEVKASISGHLHTKRSTNLQPKDPPTIEGYAVHDDDVVEDVNLAQIRELDNR